MTIMVVQLVPLSPPSPPSFGHVSCCPLNQDGHRHAQFSWRPCCVPIVFLVITSKSWWCPSCVVYRASLPFSLSYSFRSVPFRFRFVLSLFVSVCFLPSCSVRLLSTPSVSLRFAHKLTHPRRMRYHVDKDSPSKWNQPDEVYEILSKPTRQGLSRAASQTAK